MKISNLLSHRLSIQEVTKRFIATTSVNCTTRKADREYSTAISVFINYDDYYEQKVAQHESNVKSYSEIPGPKALPFIGNAWRFAPVIGQYKIQELDKVMWSLYKDYGQVVKVTGLIGHPDLLFVFDGDIIKQIFKKEEALPHRPSMPSLHYYKQKLNKSFFEGNEGVIGIHGPKWDAFRKQVQQILLPPTTARKYIEPLNTIAGDFLTRMADMRDENDELPENFLMEIYKWALESVARVALDTRLGCLDANLSRHSESQRIIDSINTFFWNVAEVELKMPVWRVYKNKSFKKYIGALEDFRSLCLKHIENTMQKMTKKNFNRIKEEDVSIVERILLNSNNPKLAAVLALDLMLVGVDTTSIALASTIYQLTQNPNAQHILHEELKHAMPDKNTPVTQNVLENIPFLKASVKEALRMYPVIIGNGRSLQSDTTIAGYHVPKGTHVIFPHLVVSNIDKYFSEPNLFKPERWLKLEKCPHAVKESKSVNEKIHPYVSLPFGYGRRSCLGRRFAEMELYILLAKLFRKYKVDYNYEPLSYKITPTYVPEQPLKFKLTEYND